MMELMAELHVAGQTIVIITHDMNIVAEFAKRVVVMANGEIVADGSPITVFGLSEALQVADIRPPQAYRIARRRPDLFGDDVLTVGDARQAFIRGPGVVPAEAAV